MNRQKLKPVLKKSTYNFYNYQTMTGQRQQCKVEVNHIIFYCGMNLHISAGIKRSQGIFCRTLLANGYTKLAHYFWKAARLFPESHQIVITVTNSVNLVGSTTMNGRCTATQDSDPVESCRNNIYTGSGIR